MTRFPAIARVRLIAALVCGTAYPALGHAQATDTLRLSIEDAVARAERLGDVARSAELQLEITEAQLDAARAGVFPSLRLNSGYTYAPRSARAQVAGRNFSQRNTYTIAASFSQPLFQGGRVFSGLRAAGRLREAARETERDARTTAALDAQRAYLTVLLSERLVEIQRTNLTLASDRVTQVERLQAGGRVARYDVLRARVERANVEPLALDAESDRRIALLELKQVLRIPLEQPIELTSRIDPDAVRATLASVAVEPMSVFAAADSRPSVRAAALTARARRDLISVARADRLPTVSAFVNGGYQAFPEGGFPTRFGQLDPVACANPAQSGCTLQNGGFFSDLSTGIQIGWNLFDGLRTRANIDLASAQARLAQLQYERARETAALEIARAQAELVRARSFHDARQQAAGESRETFQLASLRYSRGLGTQLDVSDAQLARLTAETNEARAAFDLYLATAELARALGRPIPTPPGAPSPVRSTSVTSDSIATP